MRNGLKSLVPPKNVKYNSLSDSETSTVKEMWKEPFFKEWKEFEFEHCF